MCIKKKEEAVFEIRSRVVPWCTPPRTDQMRLEEKEILLYRE